MSAVAFSTSALQAFLSSYVFVFFLTGINILSLLVKHISATDEKHFVAFQVVILQLVAFGLYYFGL